MKTVDARGKSCPLPVVETRRALKEAAGEPVQTFVDNEIAVQNLQKMAAQMGLATENSGVNGDFSVTFYAPADSVVMADAPKNACGCAPMIFAEMVVALSSNTMGAGDDTLGAALMKGFVYALTQLDHPPAAVLLYNGGAKLSCEGSDSAADLKMLEQAGTEVLTCGTCLDFYGLKETLAVGDVTNMYAITERLAGAARILRP